MLEKTFIIVDNKLDFEIGNLMSKENIFNVNLTAILIMLIGGILWVIYSYYSVCTLGAHPTWFARSGAVLVCVTIYSTLLTKPLVESLASSDLLNIYQHAKGEEPLKKEHWAKKVYLPQILSVIELFFGVMGTLIWAYGDLWLI